jgi:hypothetical protein
MPPDVINQVGATFLQQVHCLVPVTTVERFPALVAWFCEGLPALKLPEVTSPCVILLEVGIISGQLHALASRAVKWPRHPGCPAWPISSSGAG